MKEFQVNGRTASGYLAVPESGSGPGVLVLHAWWGLTDIFKQVCDRLAQEGFIALAPDLYHGKTTSSIEEAEQLASTMESEEASQDIAASIDYLLKQPEVRGKLAIVGFSLGGAYALDATITMAEEIAGAVIFYATYPGLDYSRASAAYLGHFAQNDPFEPTESVAELEQDLRAAGRPATFYTYPGTHHWFFEENRPEYDASAAHLAWQRTIEFLHQQLD